MITRLKFEPNCYLGFVLSRESRDDLLKLFPPTFEKIICHHVTLSFHPTETVFNNIITVIGESPKVVVTGYLIGQNIECFTVEINNYSRSFVNGQRYHITHSLQTPAKPVDSNKLIMNGGSSRELQIEISGTLEMIKT